MKITDFDFKLPENQIAQTPLENRAESRLLAVNRGQNNWRDLTFSAFPELLNESDVLVLNNTKVFPARLLGASETGAKVEVFLVKEIENQIWETLARPAKRLKTGRKIFFGEKLSAEVLDRTGEGRLIVKFSADGDFETVLDETGKTPLPPYIKRGAETIDADRERYQTVFAKNRGAIAAPTAGLHFTPEILEKIRAKNVEILEITLHVGYGTFEPVRVENLSEHRVMAEQIEISAETANALTLAKKAGKRIVAVGTTTTRALESSIQTDGSFLHGRRDADLTITPGYQFRAIDALLTNFHLPQSSLLVLVSTFASHKLIMEAYNHAVAEKYRFYSYGDCMFIY